MIYTVTLNPSLDYYVTLDSLTLGQVNRIQDETRVAGGKGINVSLVLKHYNVKQCALGFLGGATGDGINATLSEQGIPTNFTRIANDTRINVKIRAEQETEINSAGPAISETERVNFFDTLAQVSKGDIVVLAGSIPTSLPQTIYADICEKIVAQGATFAVDTTKEAMLGILQYKPLFIKPNHHELSEIFDVTIRNMNEAIPYAKKLHKQGAENVVISFAGEGALLVNAQGVYTAKPPKGKLVNSVGAGDSLVAGFVGAFANGEQPKEAFRYAVTTGSASAYRFGLCEKEDITVLLPEVEVRQHEGAIE
ncbi:MAG: 1-phosphofructokinase [Bacilli bacterium]